MKGLLREQPPNIEIETPTPTQVDTTTMPRRRLKTTVFFPPQTQTQQLSLSSSAHNTLEDVFVNTVRYTRSDNYNIDSILKTTTARVGSTSIALRRDCLSLQLLQTAKRPP